MPDTVNLPAHADKIVADFIDKIFSIEPKFVEGIYLTGSLPMNDFYFNKSDIDFLVLCKKLPDQKTATQLRHIHKTIKRRNSKPDLSGTYVACESLQATKFEEMEILTYHEGSMRYGIFDMAPITLSELKTIAYTIFGRKAEALPININRNDLNYFLHKNINSYWTKWINRHSSSFTRKLLLLFLPRLTEWSVLGVARQLCTLQTGKIVSKTEAGIYCVQQLPERFQPILKEAIKIRKDNRPHLFVKSYAIKPSFKRFTQTIDCVNYIIKTFNTSYNESHQ